MIITFVSMMAVSAVAALAMSWWLNRRNGDCVNCGYPILIHIDDTLAEADDVDAGWR